ncbi:unnamed protein product (macronuclear) [Paramecium tetraurelia]|uniref:RING-type domain-containing protein n=1 Tax=Paramecium tetraurelia TaxID=5888 RepID=A0CRM9_PARTE|nr:uncharacterized protein GSPATT00009761001 [Paramecium tetraurelia]CAK73446.1 unnamed protein product [Paramecium tetraurelia]|eukprot:XP_001440843.1 hypothetical protein (macronuclear) [Paramecium tetraurelia strain d4-2]
MGNILRNQKEISRNLDKIAQGQVQDTPNILIKESKQGNVDVIKLNLQIINAEIVYDSVDKIQLDLTFSSHINFQMIVHTFVTETKGGKQQRYEKSMPSSTSQQFKCPSGLNYQFPTKYIEFMIIDLLRFQKMRIIPDAQYHTLIIEMRALNSKSFQIIYFYRIDCNEQTYQCELTNTKQILIQKGRFFEINELYGVQNTLFNPEWNPNTIEDKECVICFYNMINTVLLPCKHMCTCSVCADHIIMSQKIKQCPLCRIDINNYLALEIKDKQRQDVQLQKYKEEQQKYLESIKDKKEQQAIKQGSIMEQLKSKLKEEQMKQQQLKIKNMKYFNDLDDFNQDNEQNENIYGNQSFCSYDENQNDPDHNQFNNSVKDNRQLKFEDDNNLRISNQFDDDKQKSTANQRSPCDRDFLSSYQQQQEMKDSRQNPLINQSISVENDISQDQVHSPQQHQVSLEVTNKDDEQNLNLSSQQQLAQQNGIKLQVIQETAKECQDIIIEFQQHQECQQQTNTQLIDFFDEISEQNEESKQQNRIKSLSQFELHQQPQQFQQQQQQQKPTNLKTPQQYNYGLIQNDLQDDMNQFGDKNFPQFNDFKLKTNQSQISNEQNQDFYKSVRSAEYMQDNEQRLDQEHGIQKQASLIDLEDKQEEQKDPSDSKECRSEQISLIAFD